MWQWSEPGDFGKGKLIITQASKHIYNFQLFYFLFSSSSTYFLTVSILLLSLKFLGAENFFLLPKDAIFPC
jgi:hypothetical protein